VCPNMPGPEAIDTAAIAEQLSTQQAARELVPSDPRLSARWHRHGVPSRYSRWNYHPEFEIHLITAGTGRYIIGDRIDLFSAGQLTLVGSNLPHQWISDLEPGQRIPDRDVVFQFHPQWLQDCAALMPELGDLDPLLARSRRGLEFSGATALAGARELQLIGTSTGPHRLQHIFALLGILCSAPSTEQRTLAKAWLPPLDDAHAADLVDRVFGYVIDNLVGEVRLTEAADLIGMSESAFSRYFKRVSGQTFTETVRKLRLAHACKLLEQSTLPVSTVCQRVGYANLSNFNRQFHAHCGVTPSEFRRQSSVRASGNDLA
jgi:AraC-like DNA-binding protein